MDTSKAATVICLTLVAVVAINVIIYLAFRQGIKISEIDVFRQISDRSRLPWRKEQEELDELSRLVENFKKPADRDENKPNT